MDDRYFQFSNLCFSKSVFFSGFIFRSDDFRVIDCEITEIQKRKIENKEEKE